MKSVQISSNLHAKIFAPFRTKSARVGMIRATGFSPISHNQKQGGQKFTRTSVYANHHEASLTVQEGAKADPLTYKTIQLAGIKDDVVTIFLSEAQTEALREALKVI